MKRRNVILLTKICVVIACLTASPFHGESQGQTARTVQSGRSNKGMKRVRQNKSARRNRAKKQSRQTKRRMKRTFKNAMRRQSGKGRKDNRLLEFKVREEEVKRGLSQA